VTSTATKQTLVVSKDELAEIAEWERKYADAKKKASAAEKELNFRRIALAEKVLGVNSADELKKLSPKQVENRFASRLESGDWKPAPGAPAFTFQKTSQGAYPAWKQLFVDEFGETKAAEISAETPLTYSYCVEVAIAS
jgi:hypothetical protein